MIEKILKKPYLYLTCIALIALFVLILSFRGNGEEKSETVSDAFDETAYERDLENRLKTLVEKIDGVGNVNVMVTLEGSAVCTYAQDSTQDIGAQGDIKKVSTIVFSAKSASVKEAIVSGYTLPKIKGAAIVCEKKLNASLIEKVIGVVSASLGISTDKIYVTN